MSFTYNTRSPFSHSFTTSDSKHQELLMPNQITPPWGGDTSFGLENVEPLHIIVLAGCPLLGFSGKVT